MILSDLEKLRIGCERGKLEGVSATEFLFAMKEYSHLKERLDRAENAFFNQTKDNIRILERDIQIQSDLFSINQLINWLFDNPFKNPPPELLSDNWSCGFDGKHFFIHHGDDEFVYGNSAIEAIANFQAKLESLKVLTNKQVKIISPEITTMCICSDCKTVTRIGKHLDIDCDTIKSLQDKLKLLTENSESLFARRTIEKLELEEKLELCQQSLLTLEKEQETLSKHLLESQNREYELNARIAELESEKNLITMTALKKQSND